MISPNPCIFRQMMTVLSSGCMSAVCDTFLCSVLFGHLVVEAASCSGAEESSSLVLESLRGVLTSVSGVKGEKPVAEGKTVINTLPFHLFPFLAALCRSCSWWMLILGGGAGFSLVPSAGATRGDCPHCGFSVLGPRDPTPPASLVFFRS